MTFRAQWLGILCGLLTSVIWGVQAVVSRHAMLIDLTPADVTILRFGLAAAVLLPWALRNMRPFPVGSLGWPRAWVMALLIGPLYSLILVGGAYFAPALHSSIISPGLIPVFTALLVFLVTGERAGRMRMVGLGIIVLGIGIFSRDALAVTPARPDAWIGDLLFVLIALLWAIFGLLARRWGVSSLEVTAASCLLSVPLLVIVALVLPVHMMRAPFAELLLQAVYQGVLVGVRRALSLRPHSGDARRGEGDTVPAACPDRDRHLQRVPPGGKPLADRACRHGGGGHRDAGRLPLALRRLSRGSAESAVRRPPQ